MIWEQLRFLSHCSNSDVGPVKIYKQLNLMFLKTSSKLN